MEIIKKLKEDQEKLKEYKQFVKELRKNTRFLIREQVKIESRFITSLKELQKIIADSDNIFNEYLEVWGSAGPDCVLCPAI